MSSARLPARARAAQRLGSQILCCRAGPESGLRRGRWPRTLLAVRHRGGGGTGRGRFLPRAARTDDPDPNDYDSDAGGAAKPSPSLAAGWLTAAVLRPFSAQMVAR